MRCFAELWSRVILISLYPESKLPNEKSRSRAKHPIHSKSLTKRHCGAESLHFLEIQIKEGGNGGKVWART
jgi:hypothetical protein